MNAVRYRGPATVNRLIVDLGAIRCERSWLIEGELMRCHRLPDHEGDCHLEVILIMKGTCSQQIIVDAQQDRSDTA